MVEKKKIIYRPARKDDCLQMQEIINFYADQGLMLRKSLTQLMVMTPSFFVAEYENCVIATCGFKIWGDELVEIISLAVRQSFQGQSIASSLSRLCITKAYDLGFRDIFALSAAPELFEKLGFAKVAHAMLKAKVWGDCLYCPRNAGGPGDPSCNETPLLIKM